MKLIPPTYLLMLGPPGSGKGTQAKRLQETIHLVHIASGDLFRENIKNRTALGLSAKEYIDRGDLVPDPVTIAMVMERLQRPDTDSGALLDGFPRTLPQAEALDEALSREGNGLSLVIAITVPEDVLIDRIAGRLFCRVGGESYHLTHKPPKEPGVCDVDGGELYRRPDDEPETVRNRIRVYWKQTTPLIDYYREKGILVSVDGDQSIERVEWEIRGVIRERLSANDSE